jgi:type IV secretory pathway TraG/TraD family ATPase VirD4
MAIRGKATPTIWGRWFEGKWKPLALQAFMIVIVVLVTAPIWVPVSMLVNQLPPHVGAIAYSLGFLPSGVQPGGGPFDDMSVWIYPAMYLWWRWVSAAVRGPRFRQLVAEAFAPFDRHEDMAAMGKGGSSSFGGLVAEWRQPYKPGGVWLGRSLYDGTPIGYEDDRGLLTIASNRSGKGRSLIIPNLILWPGSVLVIDPKGTNAAVTAARRGKGGGRVTDCLGQNVHVLDPFGIVEGVKSAAFNPLSMIDLAGNRAREDVGLIADALVVSTGSGDSHWDEGCRQILTGVVAHVLSRNPNATLIDVRRALTQDARGLDELFGDMLDNPVAGGVAQGAAAFVDGSSPNARGDLLATVLRNTAWLDSTAMKDLLSRSDFAMADLKVRPTSVYVVLPPDLLEEHARFMRLFVNLTVRAASQGGKSKVPILLIMDEFYSLGALNSLAKASGALAGYGLKLWPILQNLSQLAELYPKNWHTFFANAGAVQVFGVNDRRTAEELVAVLGQSVWSEKIDGRTMRQVTNLLEPSELEKLTERSMELQVVLRSGKAPLLIKKTNYDQEETFTKAMYAPDPDHDGS